MDETVVLCSLEIARSGREASTEGGAGIHLVLRHREACDAYHWKVPRGHY